MKVWLIDEGIEPEFKQVSTTWEISSPMHGQKIWKNKQGDLYNSGALS